MIARWAEIIRQRPPAIGVVLGGLVTMLGTLLPWASYETVTTERLIGISTDGPILGRVFDQPLVTDGQIVFAMGMTLEATGIVLCRHRKDWVSWLACLLTVMLMGLLIFEINQYIEGNGVDTPYTSPHDYLGPGLFVAFGGTLIAAVSLAVTTMRSFVARHAAAENDAR